MEKSRGFLAEGVAIVKGSVTEQKSSTEGKYRKLGGRGWPAEELVKKDFDSILRAIRSH